MHETQLKPTGLGLGLTESVGRNAWYAGTLERYNAGTRRNTRDQKSKIYRQNYLNIEINRRAAHRFIPNCYRESSDLQQLGVQLT